MKNTLSLVITLCSVCFLSTAQNTLYVERFDNGVMTFDLNTADVSSAGATGYNKFIINNNYTGGSGSTVCLGFPFTFNVPATSSQPAVISGSPNSNYLHTLSNIAESSGIYSCCFLAADGVCSNGENYFSKMNTDVSTIGYTGVSFSFWWLCQGGTNNYGEVYFSLDGGNNWNLSGSPISQYKNQSNWTQVTITNPLFDNQATLRFGFRFVNQQTLTAADPGFGIDDIILTGNTTSAPALTTDTATGNPFCPGEDITVEYTASGSFNTGNVFTAELSDASGSFSNPVAIGSVTSSASGVINATIPPSTLLGNGYRVRVVSSNPAVVATDNGVNLAVGTVPSVSLGTLADVCENDSPFTMYAGSPAGGDYVGTGISNNVFYAQVSGLGTFNVIYTFIDFNGCSDTATNKITVNPSPDASFSGLDSEYCNNDSPENLVGSPSGGTFLGSGITGNVFEPFAAGIGNAEVQYIFINQQSCADTASQLTTVNLCDGVDGKKDENSVALFYNAESDELLILFSSSKNETVSIEIFNSLGQKLLTDRIQTSFGSQKIQFHSGIYFNQGVYVVALEREKSFTSIKFSVSR